MVLGLPLTISTRSSKHRIIKRLFTVMPIDKQLAQLDRFHSKKIYHEKDNELPNLEGGIPVLSQILEFPSITTSSYNAQVDETEGEKVDDIVNEIDS